MRFASEPSQAGHVARRIPLLSIQAPEVLIGRMAAALRDHFEARHKAGRHYYDNKPLPLDTQTRERLHGQARPGVSSSWVGYTTGLASTSWIVRVRSISEHGATSTIAMAGLDRGRQKRFAILGNAGLGQVRFSGLDGDARKVLDGVLRRWAQAGALLAVRS